MKIFFTASYPGKIKYQKYYNYVVAAIKKLPEIELVSPEIGNYLDLIDHKKREKLQDKNMIHYQGIKAGIEWADLVVIEISHPDFQLGHEATLAIQNRKPVLCLSIYEDFSKRIKNKYFYGAKYNKFNIDRIVSTFIKDHSDEVLSERFNLFLSKRQIAQLEELAKEQNMNMSEIIRKLISEEVTS